ncbi:MAG: ParB/RepB/Spo0J family partition protein [Candidatus Kerfeldbacteria bacterium]|nr:ParB/RepB/Spo0J family partition protein [Candidatus Kerfeldbacteria bacterium]
MALGRGLDSLIPPRNSASNIANQAAASSLTAAQHETWQVPVTAISVNPHQPRRHFSHQALEELINSIREHGILQPLLVSGIDTNHYQLIAGERRLRAARIAGLIQVPVIVRDVNELEKLELALIENVQRSDLNPVERADAYHKLINEFGLNHDEAAKKVGISRSSFTNTMRLLDLPGDIQQALADGKITEGHAKVLLGLPTVTAQLEQLQLILNQQLTVRDLLNQVQGHTKQPHFRQRRRQQLLQPHLAAMQNDLVGALGTKVVIKPKGDEGTITITYYSAEELAELLRKIIG